MESQIANRHDAELILKLYELRREDLMRKARHWLIFEFNPKTAEELLAVVHGYGSQENAYYRQVISYWEMAASMVLHGAINADLFLDSQGEGIYILAKFYAFREDFQTKTGMPFMRHTSKLTEKYSVAKDLLNRMLQSMQARTS